MYRVTQQIDFCYGHRLLNYEGKCRHPHGHNGRTLIVLESDELDHRGMLVDFSDIKRDIQRWIDSELDHRMILCDRDPLVPVFQEHNEPMYLLPVNPTAENIARLIYDYTEKAGYPVLEVSLWETARSFATYRRSTTSE
ncbi:MAG: 6-carboxytetrahydropterin synthase [Planctomycetota bacterium]|nr:6-carboxytetrahydropterin synthase [Planctomycetota bacterium]MDA1211753.1 6-carboxytetrahydropterin synthase [Planctomycetota bacterium]